MRTTSLATALTLALCGAPGIARADFTAIATLLSGNQVPPHNTPATGLATVSFNSSTDSLTYNITFSGLSAPATASHIHAGGPTVNGPVVLPFTNQGPPSAVSGSFSGTLTAADLIPNAGAGINTFADAINAIETGNAYVNIHDSVFPGGEIRGQLVTAAVPEPGSLTLLTGIGASSLLMLRRTRRNRK